MTAINLSLNKHTTLILLSIAGLVGLIAGLTPISFILIGLALIFLFLMLFSHPIASFAILLILSPLRTLIATESTLALPLDIGQIILLVYFATWSIYQIQTEKSLIPRQINMVLIVTLLLTVVFGLNQWASNSTSAWITEWLKWVIIAVFIWQFTTTLAHHWRWLIFAFLASAIANAIVGLYIFFGGSGADHLLIGGRFFRAFGTFGQPNPFGGFMGIALPIALMCVYHQLTIIWKNKYRISWHMIIPLSIYASLTTILLGALIASWSRGAWLGFIISASVMAFALPQKISHSIGIALATVLLLSTLWISGVLPQSIVNRLTTAATDFITIEEIRGVDITTINYAVVERIAHWQAAINMAEANPIMGVGLGSYEVVYNDYRLINWKEPLGHAHNYYLNILAETGIIGFLTYLIFWIVIFGVTWRNRRHPDYFTRSIIIGLLGTWTYIAIHSLFDNLYVNNLFLHIGLLFSVLAIIHQQVTQKLTLE